MLPVDCKPSRLPDHGRRSARQGDHLHGIHRAAGSLLGRMARRDARLLPGAALVKGEELVPEKALFIAYLLPLRNIAAVAIETCRRHGRKSGREVPASDARLDAAICRSPARPPTATSQSYWHWLSTRPISQALHQRPIPRAFLVGAPGGLCRSRPSQQVGYGARLSSCRETLRAKSDRHWRALSPTCSQARSPEREPGTE